MNLKEKISKNYNVYCKNVEKDISGGISEEKIFTDWNEVSRKMKSLKERLCLFSDGFEKYLKCMEKSVVDDLPNGMYEFIKESFVGEISKINKNFFIYVGKPGEKWKDVNQRYREIRYTNVIKNFESMFVDFKLNFEKSKNITKLEDLIKFFERLKIDFYKSHIKFGKFIYDEDFKDECDRLCIKFNLNTAIFIKMIIGRVIEELLIEKRLFTEKRLTGSDEDYFYRKGELGSEDKHRVDPAPKGVKIFPGGRLQYHVKQAGIGDCYLLAALVSLAKTNPEAIKACFVQGLDKIETEDDIDIRLFRRVKDGDGFKKSAVIISVNKNTVIDASGIKDGALWPKLIEKAYAVYRRKGYDFFLPKHTNLTSGPPESVMFAITGEKTSRMESSVNEPGLRKPKGKKPRGRKSKGRKPDLTKIEGENIINKIIEKLKEKRAVTCTFKKDFKIEDKKSGEKVTIYTNHAYAIVGVNEEKKYIRLINPWKMGGRTILNSLRSKEGGHIAISYKVFESYCQTVSYTTGEDFPLASK